MKKISLIFAIILCCATLFSCADSEPVAKDILDADGNKVAVGYYDGDTLLYEEKTDSDGKLATKTVYDSEGRVEKVESYTREILMSETVYSYGENEGEYTVTVSSFNNKGITTSVRETKYENARPVTETVTSPSSDGGKSNVEKCTFKYNEDGTVLEIITSDGKKIRETLQDGNGIIVYDHVIADDKSAVRTYYNEESDILKTESYNNEDKLILTVVNEYGEDGKISGTKSYAADGTLKDYSVYVYDGGQLRGIYKYYADNTIHSTIVYDDEGKATVHSGVFADLG